MKSYSRSHLTDPGLLSVAATRVSLDRDTTAELLADLGEIDARKLYVPAGYDSMYGFCVHELRMSEDVACKRISAARAARRFPSIFPAVADGRLHLSAVVALAPHLTPETGDELLAAATLKSRAAIELLLAQRFPKPDVPTLVMSMTPMVAAGEAAADVDAAPDLLSAPGRIVPSVSPSSSQEMAPLPARARPVPLSSGKYAVQFTMDEEMHNELLAVQALLGHVLPSGDVAEVFRRALCELRKRLEKQKFAKSDHSRPQRGAAKGRHVPAAVRKAVWERDGGQCTFVSEKGKRCDARARLEYDHVDPVSRGGQATVAGIRLLCRAHNQFAADRALGGEFMRGKREQGRERTAKARAEADARAQAKEQEQAQSEAEAASQEELIPWLRALGCNLESARSAAARCAGMVGAPLERRMYVACQGLAPRGTRRALPLASSPA
jgi:5-methylcytosine-specific restriction endonuclease McrA